MLLLVGDLLGDAVQARVVGLAYSDLPKWSHAIVKTPAQYNAMMSGRSERRGAAAACTQTAYDGRRMS